MNKYCDFEIKPTDWHRNAKVKTFKKDYYENLEEAKSFYYQNLSKKENYPCRKYHSRRSVPASFCLNCDKERCRFDLLSIKKSRFER